MVKVSIIISVYNAEKYLKECLDSAVNQTLEDIEIICVNDGSTDDSLNILKSYAEKDSRVKVFTQPNKGQGAALNTALDNVRGEYVLNIDCDDWIELDACEFLYNKSKELNLDLLFNCGVVYNEHDGEYFAIPYYNFPKFDSSLENRVFTFKDIDYYFDICVTNWTKFYRADFLKEHDFKFKDCYFQDNIFHWDVLLNAKRISFSKRQLIYHRIRDGQISFNYNENYFDHIVMSDYIVEVFKKNNRFEEYKANFYKHKDDDIHNDISIEVLSTVLHYIQSIKDIDIYNIEILRDINKKLETINNLKDINVGYFFLLENLYFDMKDLLNDLMLYKVNVEEYREEIDNIIT